MKLKAACFAAIICLGFVILSALNEPELLKNNNETSGSSTVLFSETSTTVASVYTLKEYNGKLAVFETGTDCPLEVFSIFVSSLPETDRDMLKTGIGANTKAELLRLIEDYTG
ncbi:MAG: hypothetical protein BWY46_01979 [Firmicutes bacterium ADurb.Bin300]|nr:MAG: hypothetical protein BWY46_01979 [Firmicutes bacterium ADurb.Bin300]HOD02299.1 hypothetical protein [Clostridiales bacterium]